PVGCGLKTERASLKIASPLAPGFHLNRESQPLQSERKCGADFPVSIEKALRKKTLVSCRKTVGKLLAVENSPAAGRPSHNMHIMSSTMAGIYIGYLLKCPDADRRLPPAVKAQCRRRVAFANGSCNGLIKSHIICGIAGA